MRKMMDARDNFDLQNRNYMPDGHQSLQSNCLSQTQYQSTQNGQQNYLTELNRSSQAGLDDARYNYGAFQSYNAGNTLFYPNGQACLQNRNFMPDGHQSLQSNCHSQRQWYQSTQNGQQNYSTELNRSSHAALDDGRYNYGAFQSYNAGNTLFYPNGQACLQNRNFMPDGHQSLQSNCHSQTQWHQSTQNGQQNYSTELNRSSHAGLDDGRYNYGAFQSYNAGNTLFYPNGQACLQNRNFMPDGHQSLQSNCHSQAQWYQSTQNGQQNYSTELNRASHAGLDDGRYNYGAFQSYNAGNTLFYPNGQALDSGVLDSAPNGGMNQNQTDPADQINERDLLIATDDITNESDVNVTDDQIPNKETDDRLIEHCEGERNTSGSMNVKPKQKVGCDNTNMIVKYSDDASPKKLCCPFCDKLQTKLPRHMEAKHKDEPDVQRSLSFPKGSRQRRAIQDSLRKIGLDNWNRNDEINDNELIPSRRPNRKFSNDAARFITCPHCRGQHTKLGLRLHVKYHCPMKPVISDNIRKSERTLTALATSVEARHHIKASKALTNVFKNFRNDTIVRSIKFDWLIIAYGNKMSAEYPQRKNKGMIRGHLRLVGRFLHELKRIEPEITNLAAAYQPQYFDRIVEAVQNVARFDPDNGEYDAPGTANKCVTVIKKIGSVLISEFIKQRNREKKVITKEFMTLMNNDIHGMINKTANRNQNQRKRLTKVNLPAMDDVKLMAQYLQSESSKCYNELVTSFDYKNWLQLSKLTLASILVFNRKRVGDTENILVEEFECRELMNEETNEQLFLSLSDESKEIAKRYCRMEVCGKKDKNVPVLLNSFMEKNIDILIAHRENAGLTSANKFLFGIPSSTNDKVLDAGKIINTFSRLCGAKNPSFINGTNMRKHLATHCVTLKLNDPEVADVCDFMGHAELVHRKVYRQNTIERQVVNMSKVLEAAQGNITQTNTVGEDDVRSRAVRKRKKSTPDQQVKKKSQQVNTKKSQQVNTKKSRRVVSEKCQRIGRKSKK